jgi:deoxycytidylate deaminase
MDQVAAKLARDLAASSPCKKRKVGAVIVSPTGTIISTGINHNPTGDCEDSLGNTMKSTLHAEVDAILNAGPTSLTGSTIYVTHEPCGACAAYMAEVGISTTIVVDEFLKFDHDKLRFDLVPPVAFEALAEVLTYGARKYKANNWKNCNDTSRYIAATYRHIEAYRKGEQYDPESGLSHLKHALTNIAFLLYFEEISNG